MYPDPDAAISVADASPAADDFAQRLLAWFDASGRHDLPWQHPRAPYRVWLAEIMLQQTQVRVVVPYFGRFVAALPTLPALAAAPLDQVLALWSGLGYYARARNLHAAAQLCVARHGAELPHDFEALRALPGIGRSTAGAILAQAWGERVPILDGNVKRVLCRVHGIDGWPGTPAVEKQLWTLADRHLPHARLADYTQAQMDFGATLCTRFDPACMLCPLQQHAPAGIAHQQHDRTALGQGPPGLGRGQFGDPVLAQREAVVLQRTQHAGRIETRAQGRAKIHLRLGVVGQARLRQMPFGQ